MPPLIARMWGPLEGCKIGNDPGGKYMVLRTVRECGPLAGSRIVKTLGALAVAVGMAAVSGTPARAGPSTAVDCSPNICDIQMKNFGGPTMTGTTNIYDIWYGDWGGSSSINAMAEMFSALSGTDYMKSLGAIYGVSTDIAFKGTTLVNDYLGDNLSDANLATIVKDFTNPANANGGPAQTNAIYFIFTAPNVHEQSENISCGFHSDTGGLKFAWLNSSLASQSGCGSNPTTFDNLTMNTTAQLFDTLTDPMVNEATGYAPPLGWYDGGPNLVGEVADPCNQHADTVSEGAATYTVQQIFHNDTYSAGGGLCISAYYNPDGTLFTNPPGPPAGVPEPAEWALLIAGFAVCGGTLRHRRTKLAA
jgi:hypothetical protein